MKIYTFRGQKGENRSLEPKHGIWVPKTEKSCDIYTSIGHFTRSKKMNTFEGPKSVWSCDISTDRKFYIDEENTCFKV
jgi:hypothetical protein